MTSLTQSEGPVVRCLFPDAKSPTWSKTLRIRKTNRKLHFTNDEETAIQLADLVNVVYDDENSNGDCRLRLVRYVIDGVRRKRQDVLLEFENAKTAERWHYKLRKTLVPRPPPHNPRSKRTRRRVLVLVNPFSGLKKAEKIWESDVRPVLDLGDVEYEVVRTDAIGHGTRIAASIDLDAWDAVLIDSGDGLVSEFIYGLLQRDDRDRALRLPIGHIPGGTSNALSASICYSVNEPFPPWGDFATQHALMVARPRFLPLKLFNVDTANNGRRQMFMTSVWGIIADIDIGSERFRWAGMIRLHMEAVIRIARLPTTASYRGRISYIPAGDTEEEQKRLIRATMLRADAARKAFGKGHFDYPDVEPWSGGTKEKSSESKRIEMPPLDQPLDSTWTTIEGDYVCVMVSAISHIGSDLPQVASAKFSDEVLFLTIIDWATVKTRFHVAHQLITICDSQHLGHASMQIIPVKGVRVEPLDDLRGYFTIDGEAFTRGSAFQVFPSGLAATVIGRDEVRR